MATERILAVFDLAGAERRHAVRHSILSDYWTLTKPEVNFLIALTTMAAFWLGSPKYESLAYRRHTYVIPVNWKSRRSRLRRPN
jgi:heme O synthase-like polyprenyltransferase